MRNARWGAATRLAGRGVGIRAVKVPAVGVAFWVVKASTTAFGESASDWSVRVLSPVPAVLLGFVGFVVALGLQLRATSYAAWRYWLTVSMVGVFGTMAADVVHVGLGVPYAASAAVFAVALAAVFVVWRRIDGDLAMHSIISGRRELFYWAAVVTTFALGTAIGDFTAVALRLGYAASVLLFAGLIALPVIAYRTGVANPVVAFWAAYVLTRPVGASVADWLGKPTAAGGLGVGSGVITIVLGTLLLAMVAVLQYTGADRPRTAAGSDRPTDPAPRPHR